MTKEERKEYNAKYYQANKERLQQERQGYYRRAPEKWAEYQRAYRAKKKAEKANKPS